MNQLKYSAFNRFCKAIALFIFFLFIPCLSSLAQTGGGMPVVLMPVAKTTTLPPRLVKGFQAKDSIQAIEQLKSWLGQLHETGHYLASIDSVGFSSEKIYAYYFAGPRFNYIDLAVSSKQESNILTESGLISHKKKEGIKLQGFDAVTRLKSKVLDYAQNNGYPFAKVKVDEFSVQDQRITGQIYVQTGSYITFDTLLIPEEIPVKPKFLSAYLGIRPGLPFSQQKLRQARRQIQRLPYLNIDQMPTPVFEYDKAVVKLSLKKKKANQIDGIIGFLPNNRNGQNGLLLTGQFLLDLYNPFGTGKRIYAYWQQFKQQSQQLALAYQHPALLGTPLTLEANLELLKEDSTFLNFSRKISLEYNGQQKGNIGFFADLRSTRLLGNTTDRGTSLIGENLAQTNFLQYGLSYRWDNLDQQVYPRKGWKLYTSLGIGNKTIRPLLSQGDSVTLQNQKSLQTMAGLSIEKYFSLGKNGVLLVSNRIAGVFNNNLFLNDLYRLGGLRSLRGFSENTFFASQYSITTLETRFFFEEASFLFLFADNGLLFEGLGSQANWEHAFGTGAGMSFQTKNGIFSLVYALGRSDNQIFSPAFSKIHFGFTGNF